VCQSYYPPSAYHRPQVLFPCLAGLFFPSQRVAIRAPISPQIDPCHRFLPRPRLYPIQSLLFEVSSLTVLWPRLSSRPTLPCECRSKPPVLSTPLFFSSLLTSKFCSKFAFAFYFYCSYSGLTRYKHFKHFTSLCEVSS